MTPDDSPLADELSALLAACDEALAAGGAVPTVNLAAPAALRPALREGVAALQLLHQLRPRRVPAPVAGRLGRFVIHRELGKGSFGIVYLAHDPDLRRDVALKVPHGQALVSAELRQRFQQEARAAGALDHPNLVPVYEAGEIDGVLYIASAYCPGDTLAGRLRGRDDPVPPRRAAAVVAALAGAVQHAHERGVLHRDLKPGNVLLQAAEAEKPRGGPDASTVLPGHAPEGAAAADLIDGTPRVTDFGLARFLLDEEAGDALTRTGAIVGTPCYMAPEQAMGQGRAVGPAADVYGLGAILYELLTRRPPFQADTPLETLEQVRSREPVAPRQLRPGVPRDLETVCLKCLHKEPARRYSSAEELRRDLQRYLDGEPILARPVGAVERAARAARRHPAIAALALALALVTVAGVAGVFWMYLDAKEQEALAHDAAGRAEEKAELAQEQERRALELLRQTEIARYALQLALARTEWQTSRPFMALSHLRQTDERHRHWEYRHLVRMFQGSERVLAAPGNGIVVAADAAGACIASGGEGHVVRVWDGKTGQPGPLLEGHAGDVRCISVRRDATLVATASRDKTVRVWDARTGKPVHVFRHADVVEGVAFSPDGRSLATCSRDGTARVLDVRTWKETHALPRQQTKLHGLAYHPLGHALALVREKGGVALWDLSTGGVKDVDARHNYSSYSLAFRSGGKSLVTLSSANQLIETRDASTGELLGVRPTPDRGTCVAVSPDDRRLAVGLEDGTISVVESATGREVQRLRGQGRVCAVAFLGGGERLVSSGGKTVRIWRVGSSPEVLTCRAPSRVVGAAFSPDGSRLAFSTFNSVAVLDTATGRELRAFKFRRSSAHRAAFLPDGRRLVIAGSDELKVWDVETGRASRALPVQGNPTNIALSPDGHLLAAAVGHGVALFDAESGKELRALTGHTWLVRSVAFSPDGRLLATGSSDRTARVWDVVTGAVLHTLTGHGDRLTSVAFGRDGLLATAAQDDVILLWDAATGKRLRTIRGRGPVGTQVQLAFSPDGRRLVSSHDTEVHLWDVATAQTVLTLPPTPKVFAVAFSPDGGRLATTEEGHARIWLTAAEGR